MLHEAFTDGAHLLLFGSMLFAYTTSDSGKKVLETLTAMQEDSPRSSWWTWDFS